MMHLSPRPGKRLCGTCLWLWPGLKGEPDKPKRCYNGECRHYRQERQERGKACLLYEARPQMVGWADRGRRKRRDGAANLG